MYPTIQEVDKRLEFIFQEISALEAQKDDIDNHLKDLYHEWSLLKHMSKFLKRKEGNKNEI